MHLITLALVITVPPPISGMGEEFLLDKESKLAQLEGITGYSLR